MISNDTKMEKINQLAKNIAQQEVRRLPLSAKTKNRITEAFCELILVEIDDDNIDELSIPKNFEELHHSTFQDFAAEFLSEVDIVQEMERTRKAKKKAKKIAIILGITLLILAIAFLLFLLFKPTMVVDY